MKTLLADLTDATGDDILDGRGVDPATLDQCIKHCRAEIGRMPLAQCASALGASGSNGFDDISGAHDNLLCPSA